MQPVLFHIPILKDQFPPDGIPIHGFGVMLFLTFILAVRFLTRRSRVTHTGLTSTQAETLVIILFIAGLVGARILFMVQYGIPWHQFLKIWEGGIVLYGGIILGMIVFAVYHFRVLKPAGVPFWKLTDAVAPVLALGIALGRVGCLLNGCCYGHAAVDAVPQIHFPSMTAPVAEVVLRNNWQTPLGFTVVTGENDSRSVVSAVEPGSNARRAGLQPGDVITEVNGKPNLATIEISAPKDSSEAVRKAVADAGGSLVDDAAANESPTRLKLWAVPSVPEKFTEFRITLRSLLPGSAFTSDTDGLGILARHWPRSRNTLELKVDRLGTAVTIDPFVPRTIGIHPTQLYETISMFLLIVLLVSYYPFRRHDGQVFTLFVFCYAIHRFLNEILRNDTPIEGFRMTISQNISVGMVAYALILEAALRWAKIGRRDGPVTPEGTAPAATAHSAVHSTTSGDAKT